MGTEAGSKPKKPFYKKWWFWVIVVIVVIVALTGGGGGDTGATTSGTTPSGSSDSTAAAGNSGSDSDGEVAEEPQVAKIGDTIDVDELAFTVNDVATTTKLSSVFGEKTGNWIVVTVTIKNNSKEAVTIDSSFFKLVESDGTTYETDSDGLMYIDQEDSLFLEQINPKLEKQGKVLFAIPESATDFVLQVQADGLGIHTGEISLAK